MKIKKFESLLHVRKPANHLATSSASLRKSCATELKNEGISMAFSLPHFYAYEGKRMRLQIAVPLDVYSALLARSELRSPIIVS